ncbi:serine/threonine protein kinase, partial [bacterium]|nr:serine/threonine protein kinase [bacterium]
MGKELYIGRYQVIRELGRGGMGIVYEGIDPILDRQVAIKVLPPKKTASKKSVQRFLREARVSARLDHPHIVKIYDIGEEDGMFHIVMEYVPGDSLRDLIEDEKPINIPYMAELFAQLCNAMSYAHSQHITHRDIKPENIKVTLDNKIKVMDFGIAVLDDNHSLTATGSVMGTIAYFSPEQARGEEADYRADIYSMGIVFYEMLTKMLPFEASSLPDMLNKHLYDKPIYPTRRNPDIPKVFEDLILKCMEKVPDLRFSSASEMETIVRDYLSGQSKVQSVVKELQDDKIAVLKAELLASLNSDKTDFGSSIPNKKSSVEKSETITSSKPFKKDKTFYTVEKYKNVDYTPTVMPINPSAALSSLMAEVEEEQKKNASISSTMPEVASSEFQPKKEEPKEEPPKMSKMQQMKEAEAKKKEAEAKKLEEKNKKESIDTDDEEDLKEESLVLPIIPQATPMVAENTSEGSDKNNYNNYIDRMKKDATEYKGDFEFSGGSIICPHCGQENVSGQLACSRCNADLSSISQN